MHERTGIICCCAATVSPAFHSVVQAHGGFSWRARMQMIGLTENSGSEYLTTRENANIECSGLAQL